MKLKEIASRIDAYLKRFERDPKINMTNERSGSSRYWRAHAYVTGSRVGVVYVSYQGTNKLTKTDAISYLAWLDAGNIGTHWKAPDVVI